MFLTLKYFCFELLLWGGDIDCCTWIYFPGEVWNWANDGGPRREDALRACDARTQQEAQTNVI